MTQSDVIAYAMPKLAMAMSEGTIAEWLVADGSYVEKGAALATIETEKVAYDVESPEAGYFFIETPQGQTVGCGARIGCFSASPDKPAMEMNENQPSTSAAPVLQPDNEIVATVETLPTRIKISPLARKLAADAGLAIEALRGSGPRGRIVKRDVLTAIAAKDAKSRSGHSAHDKVLATIPLTGLRGTIATRMMESLHNSAQLSSNWESDITRMLGMRGDIVGKADILGTRVSVNAFLIKALTYAIRRVPSVNANLIDDQIVIYKNINMGMAISLPYTSEYETGLVVGVLRNVDTMGLVDIDLGLRALIERVRSGSATPEDVTGSTFTLSSTAGIGPPGLMTTPVLNQPNVALLGVSTPIDRPMFVDSDVRRQTMLPLSLTFDHRALDGEPAARFMSALNDALENPTLLLA